MGQWNGVGDEPMSDSIDGKGVDSRYASIRLPGELRETCVRSSWGRLSHTLKRAMQHKIHKRVQPPSMMDTLEWKAK